MIVMIIVLFLMTITTPIMCELSNCAYKKSKMSVDRWESGVDRDLIPLPITIIKYK